MEDIVISPIGSQADWNGVVCVARSLGYAMISEKGARYESLFSPSHNAIRLGEDGSFGNGKARWYGADKYDDYTQYSAEDFIEEFGSSSPCGSTPATFSGLPTPRGGVTIVQKITHLA